MATLIACTYTVLHLSVPEQRDGRDSGFSGWLKWWWKRTYPSLLWMVITIIAPEYYAFVALENRGSARFFASRLKKLGEEMQPPGGWTTTHAFFAEMGGFAVRSNTTRRPQDVTHLTGHSLLKLLELHHQEINFKYLPSKEDIENRSKRDGFAKSLVIFQMVYFGVNCVTRLSSGLAVTQLEMSVLTTAVCSQFSFAYYSENRTLSTPPLFCCYLKVICPSFYKKFSMVPVNKPCIGRSSTPYIICVLTATSEAIAWRHGMVSYCSSPLSLLFWALSTWRHGTFLSQQMPTNGLGVSAPSSPALQRHPFWLYSAPACFLKVLQRFSFRLAGRKRGGRSSN